MLEINEDIPFLWRLSSDNGEGFCMVSMVVPFNSDEGSLEHTIETDVLSFNSEGSGDDEEILEWNEDDINLFLKLIAKRLPGSRLAPGETIKVDLNDPAMIEIVQIVAAAGFGLVQPAEAVLRDSSNTEHFDFELEVGAQASLNTWEGYKRCIIVEIEDDEVVCVMLDKLELATDDEYIEISPHELLIVKRHQVLHSMYTSEAPVPTDVLH